MNPTEPSDPLSPAARPARRTPRWVLAALAVSVALNLAVGGIAVGSWLKPHRGPGFPVSMFALRAAMRDLPEADRAAIGAALKATRDEMRPVSRLLADDHAALVAALRAEPFDADVLARLLADQRARFGALRDAGDRRLVAVLAALSPASRQTLADRLPAPHRP